MILLKLLIFTYYTMNIKHTVGLEPHRFDLLVSEREPDWDSEDWNCSATRFFRRFGYAGENFGNTTPLNQILCHGLEVHVVVCFGSVAKRFPVNCPGCYCQIQIRFSKRVGSCKLHIIVLSPLFHNYFSQLCSCELFGQLDLIRGQENGRDDSGHVRIIEIL